MARRALRPEFFAISGFIAIDRDHHRETRNLVPTGQAIAQIMRAALAAFIARVLRVRIGDLSHLREQACKYAGHNLNLDAARRV